MMFANEWTPNEKAKVGRSAPSIESAASVWYAIVPVSKTLRMAFWFATWREALDFAIREMQLFRIGQ
jgi:hypothetical protein